MVCAHVVEVSLPDLAWTDIILPNFVEEGFVADFERGCRSFTVPAVFFQCLSYSFHFLAVLQVFHPLFQVQRRSFRS